MAGDYNWNTPPSATGAPSRLTVATCQMPVTHDLDRNVAHITDLIRSAAEAGADVAHFPECALSGYGASTWPCWDGFDWDALDVGRQAIREAARSSGLWIVTGTVHRSSPSTRPTNAMLVVDRQGDLVGRYDKQRCSVNDLRAFAPGDRSLTVDIEGVRCGFLICLDWAFPELWQGYAGQAELIFHSCVSDRQNRDKIAAHVIPSLMQGYAWLHQFAISVSNSCRPKQDFSSFWIERSGHKGRCADRDQADFTVNALADDPDQDRFFAMVRQFRASAADGSLYAPHRG